MNYLVKLSVDYYRRVVTTSLRLMSEVKLPPIVAKGAKNPSQPTSKSTVSKCKNKEDTRPKCKGNKEENKQGKEDLTQITGGAKCKLKKKNSKNVKDQKPKNFSCKQLPRKQAGLSSEADCVQDLTAVRGVGVCLRSKKSQNEPSSHAANKWRKISLLGALPFIALLTLFIFSTREEKERPEFVPYDYKYKREKQYFFYDGSRTLFHNPKINALPQGYEDEIDEAAFNQPEESDKEKQDSLKKIQNIRTQWQKEQSVREKQAAKG